MSHWLRCAVSFPWSSPSDIGGTLMVSCIWCVVLTTGICHLVGGRSPGSPGNGASAPGTESGVRLGVL